MAAFQHKKIAVFGLDSGGQAVCRLLSKAGARVSGVTLDGPELSQKEAADLANRGIKLISQNTFQTEQFDLVALGSSFSRSSPLFQTLLKDHRNVIGDLEIAYQSLCC